MFNFRIFTKKFNDMATGFIINTNDERIEVYPTEDGAFLFVEDVREFDFSITLNKEQLTDLIEVLTQINKD